MTKRKSPPVATAGSSENVEPHFAEIDAPWKSDDRRWFERHPNRTHRIRRVFHGEMESLGFDPAQHELPAGTANFAVVRHLRPGVRTRRFARLEVERFPQDDECAAHALFDSIAESDNGQRGTLTVLDSGELIARARAYADASARKAS